jgi:vitamin B12 transporter
MERPSGRPGFTTVCSYRRKQIMKVSIPVSLRRCLAFLAGLVPVLTAFAQTDQSASAPVADSPLKLDQMVVSASRTPQDPRNTSSAVSPISLDELATEQITTLKDALAQQPGVIVVNSGAVGSQSSIFLRGANSDQTLFVVDGVSMSSRSASDQNFLGGADLAGIDRVEVLRGPQSTLYGSTAMGGVILIDSAHGAGPVTGKIEATAGSFGSYGGEISTAGAGGRFGFSGSLGYDQTENDRPQNDYDGWSGSTRLEYNASPEVLVGFTFRGLKSSYDEPGSTLFLSPGHVDFSNYLTTVYAQARLGDGITSRLTLASHLIDYDFTSSYGSSPSHNNRRIADWQNTWEASQKVEVVAGLNHEESRYDVADTPTSDRLAAGYASATVRAADNLTLTGGIRYDDYRSAGDATTGRAGIAWNVTKTTKLRATYGTGFNAPGSDDIFGVPSYGQLPSPGLQPEESRGWDVGVDQNLFGGAGALALTWFQNKFHNLFDYEIVDFDTYAGRTINRAHATTEGFEVAASGRVNSRLTMRASYTYLEATDDDTGERLDRRPRNTGDAEMRVLIAQGWLAGAGLHVVAGRLDGGTPLEDYTTMRFFVSYAGPNNLRVNLRVENALDEAYQEVRGYPALPRGAYGSIDWRF